MDEGHANRRTPAVLLLESGRCFRGWALGARTTTFGEAVFNTSMTGYQEILTDPSYTGQIVVFTAAHVGNTGINLDDDESERPRCAGLVIREAASMASSWRARIGLREYLIQRDIAGIEGIDTRALTRALRTGGAQRSAIVCAGPEERSIDAQRVSWALEQVRAHPRMEGLDLAARATCERTHAWPTPPESDSTSEGTGERTGERALRHVVVYDFGVKRNILRQLALGPCRITVVPAHTPASQTLDLAPDGVFLSNGPGDPAAVPYAIEAVRALIDTGKPIFGVCLGHQILALALGARTYKLRFGHHGGNHPVKELATGRVEITAQNHGFAVARDSLPGGVACTHVSLYDGTVEGIRVVDRPIESVQHHPEASPGPHDAQPFFGRFFEALAHVA